MKHAMHAKTEEIRKMGKGKDTILAHITPREANLLHIATDGASINPATGLPMFDMEDDPDSRSDASDGSPGSGRGDAEAGPAGQGGGRAGGRDFMDRVSSGLRNISSPFSVPTGQSAGFLKALPVAGAMMSLVEFLQGAGFKSEPVKDDKRRGGDRDRPGLPPPLLTGLGSASKGAQKLGQAG